MKVDYSKYLDKVRFWKTVIENAKEFIGTSPPTIFVGRFFYPKVNVGILSPPQHIENAAILDSPEDWYKMQANISDILHFRGQMIFSRFRTSSVRRPSGKLEEVTQEVAMAKKQTDVEIELWKNPKFNFMFNPWHAPIGNPAPIVKARLTENPTVERKVDYVISDLDLKANNAVIDLYSEGLQTSRIQKIFSAGLIGVPIQRKFVPTRWSITAVDDIIGKSLREKIKDFPELNEIQLFHNEYLGNHYEILVLPKEYQFELVEVWNSDLPKPSIGSDYEQYWGRKDYATNTHGAFYAGRLAVLEYLMKIKRQASILIVREILPSYDIPMGIWQLRETVRGAFETSPEKFTTVGQAIEKINSRLISSGKWIAKSKFVAGLKEQTSIKKFINKVPL